MRVLGCDCGLAGGLAIVSAENGAAPQLIDAIDIPTLGINAQRRVNPHAVRDFILKHSPQLAAVERAQGFPLQGRSSIFLFGRAAGVLEAVIALCNIPTVMVEPAKWKKHFRLPRDKEASRQMALRLFPGAHALFALRRSHNKAEAVLLALYGAQRCQGIST
jgi:crossover junction endodeoxyribonuclease RuvC